MNRFDPDNRTQLPEGTGRAVMLIVLAAIVGVVLYLLSSFGSQTTDRQEESLRRALERDIVQCYALEGTYPPSLSYIEEHYGLTYDHSTFYVDYRPIGANLYPDVTILQIKGDMP